MAIQQGQQALAADMNRILPEGSIIPFAGKIVPQDFLPCDGSAVSRASYPGLFAALCPSGQCTISIASPTVISFANHGFAAGDKIHFKTTGTLPTGLVVNTDYFVIAAGLGSNDFRVSATRGGAAVNTSGSQSGVHTAYYSNWGKGDGSTTFNLPDLRGYTPYGQKTSDTNFDGLNVPNAYVGEKAHQLTAAELASHSHPIAMSSSGSGSTTNAMRSSGGQDATQNSGSAGSNGAHNNMPPYVVVQFIIKAVTYV